jgi:hypothetical protein
LDASGGAKVSNGLFLIREIREIRGKKPTFAD